MDEQKKMSIEKIDLKVFRYDPDQAPLSYYDIFRVNCGPYDQLLDILIGIKEKADPSLSFRRSCRHGICGSCAVRVNNKPVLACKTSMYGLIDEFGPSLTVDPLEPDRVVKDLIIDKEDFWGKYTRVDPCIQGISGSDDATLRPRVLETLADADYCIQCSICYSVCPVVKILPEFLGPAAFTRAYRFAFDPRDHSAERLSRVVRNNEGVWDCVKCLQCTEACPKHIDPFTKITRLHELGVREKAGVDKMRFRHAEGFRTALRRVGIINELVLAWQTLHLGVIRMIPRGVLMFLKGKLHINPFFPRSRRLKEIKTAFKRKKR